MKFSKPSKSIDDQIDLLKSRGLLVENRDRAYRYLSHISYYRLRIYWLPFEEKLEGTHQFKDGTKFEDVINLYVFDRKLRLMMLEAVERFEVSFRSLIVNFLATTYGSHAYLEEQYFTKPEKYLECVNQLKESIKGSKEDFIHHYKNNYDEPIFPPIWVAFEILQYGQLVKWYQRIRKRDDRKKISKTFNLDEKVMSSFVLHLNHVRNISAHHGRLWNRHLTITMKIPNYPKKLSTCFNHDKQSLPYIYNTLTMLAYLTSVINPSTTWTQRLKDLLNDFELADKATMGFPSGWESLPIWNEKSPIKP